MSFVYIYIYVISCIYVMYICNFMSFHVMYIRHFMSFHVMSYMSFDICDLQYMSLYIVIMCMYVCALGH